MNKLIAFLFVFLALSALLAISVHSVRASGDLWTERTPMPNAESNFGAVSVNGEIYAIGHDFTMFLIPLLTLGFQKHRCQVTDKALPSLLTKIKSTL